jgi:prepilin-type N-terminal cleavage/methylation domain-containing protein
MAGGPKGRRRLGEGEAAMRSERSGFTLVELLVVITIIGILIALLMPAVQSVREAGRRVTCGNNAKQMALACLQHETKFGWLPTGGWGWKWAGDPTRGFSNRQPGGWHYNILPFLGLDTLHDGLATPYNNQQGQVRARTPVATFYCPSRRRVAAYPLPNATSYINITDPYAISPPVIGRSDYAANAGDGGGSNNWPAGLDTSNSGPGAVADNPPPDWTQYPGSVNSTTAPATGIIYRASMTRFTQIKNGPANTYLLGERYLNPAGYYTGTQCDDDQGWDTGYEYDVNRWTLRPPHRDQAGWTDDSSHAVQNTQSSCWTMFGSAHPAGFQMAFCDGQVRLINFNVTPALHQQLGTRAGGQLTDLSEIFR